MLDISEAAKTIASKLMADAKAGKLDKIGIDEVRDAIAEHTFPETLGRVRAEQLEVLTLRKLIAKIG